MALLLARLEQENNALMSDSKAGIKANRARSQSRPPSFNQLKRLVQDETSNVRFSQLPSPPPMTELEFWAALVRDYPQTVQRLPTLCLNKIRGGIPAPLRGVVWQSASGSRQKLIEDQYETLCGESSPYENIINKDLGRSFPGVEMFKVSALREVEVWIVTPDWYDVAEDELSERTRKGLQDWEGTVRQMLLPLAPLDNLLGR